MPEEAAAATRNSSASLRRALAILLHLGEDAGAAGGTTLAELASELAMNKSTLLRLLGPLQEARLVERHDESGRYRLGPRNAQLGQTYLEQLDLRGTAHDVLRALMDETGETTHLVLADFPDVVYVDKVDSTHPVRMHSRIGARQAAYSTAVGKALLAHADETALRRVVDAGLTARTPNTRTTERKLRADLAAVHQRGYAVDDVENEPDIRCVAAPAFDHTGATACAVSVSGPAARVSRSRVSGLGEQTALAAAEISRRLGAR